MSVRHYRDHSGAYVGAFSGAEPPPGSIEVPEGPADARQKWNDGEWLPHVPPPPLALHQIGAASLQVEGWDITGIERSVGITGAFMLDTDLAMIFLADDYPDCDYIVMPSDGVTKYSSYVEVTRPGLSSISFIIQRVQ